VTVIIEGQSAIMNISELVIGKWSIGSGITFGVTWLKSLWWGVGSKPIMGIRILLFYAPQNAGF